MSTTAPLHPSPDPPQQQQQQQQIQKEESTAFLRSLINKNLRITTTDNRMFWGAFKCTDSVNPPHLIFSDLLPIPLPLPSRCHSISMTDSASPRFPAYFHRPKHPTP